VFVIIINKWNYSLYFTQKEKEFDLFWSLAKVWAYSIQTTDSDGKATAAPCPVCY